MVTTAQIARLSDRIDKLAERIVQPKPTRRVLIVADFGETGDERLARHYAEHPEDRDGAHVIVVEYINAIDGRPAPHPEEGSERPPGGWAYERGKPEAAPASDCGVHYTPQRGGTRYVALSGPRYGRHRQAEHG